MSKCPAAGGDHAWWRLNVLPWPWFLVLPFKRTSCLYCGARRRGPAS